MSAARYRARRGLYAVELDGQILIWDAEREHLHRLNESAARVWSGLADWTSAEDATAAIAGTAPAPASLARDVAGCIDELVVTGLLEVDDGRPSPSA